MIQADVQPLPRWATWIGGIGLAAFSVLWAARWPAFPLVLDPYYHLFVAREIVDAGGPILYEWWQHAPVGRPHLYPPILHGLLAAGLGAGFHSLTVIRFASVVLVPGLLVSLYAVARRLMPQEEAIGAVWLALIPFGFHLHSAVALAATLGVIELLWLLLALERGRSLALGALFVLMVYTHLGLPWIALLACGTYVFLRPDTRETLWRARWAVLLALPWWVHLLRNRAFFHPVPRVENALMELWPGMLLLALAGVWECLREPRKRALPIACGAGFALLGLGHIYRWANGEGVLAIALFGGVGLSVIAGACCGRQRTSRKILAMLALAAVTACLPTVSRADRLWRVEFRDSSPWHLVGLSRSSPKDLETSFAVPKIVQLAHEIQQQSRPGQILWSNAPYALGLVAALAHRPMASAMFNEVASAEAFDVLEASQVFVWFKMPSMPGEAPNTAMSPAAVTKVFENDLAVILARTSSGRTARAPEAALPWRWAAAMGLSLAGLVFWDLRRKRHSPDRSV